MKLVTTLFFVLLFASVECVAQVTNITLGTTPNDGTGDTLRAAGVKINANDNWLQAGIDGKLGTNQFATNFTAQAATNSALQTQITANSNSIADLPATSAEVSAGTVANKYVSPKTLAGQRNPADFNFSPVYKTNAPVTGVYDWGVVNAYDPTTKRIYRSFWENFTGQIGNWRGWQKLCYSTNFGTTWTTPVTYYSNAMQTAVNKAFGVTKTGRLISLIFEGTLTNEAYLSTDNSVFQLTSDDGGDTWSSNAFTFAPYTGDTNYLVVPHGRINMTPSGTLIASVYTVPLDDALDATAHVFTSVDNADTWTHVGSITNNPNNVFNNETQIWPVNDTFWIAVPRNGGNTHGYIFASTNAGANWYINCELRQPGGNVGESSPFSVITYSALDGTPHIMVAHGERNQHRMLVADAALFNLINPLGVRLDALTAQLTNNWMVVGTNTYSGDIAYPSLLPIGHNGQVLVSYSMTTNSATGYIVDKILSPQIEFDATSLTNLNLNLTVLTNGLQTGAFSNLVSARIPVFVIAGVTNYITLSTNAP